MDDRTTFLGQYRLMTEKQMEVTKLLVIESNRYRGQHTAQFCHLRNKRGTENQPITCIQTKHIRTPGSAIYSE